MSVREATSFLHGKSTSELNELLFQRGVDFNNLPLWQRRGTGIYWERIQKEGFNPVAGVTVIADRRRIRIDESLPKGDEYDRFLIQRIE
jgi:tRNA(His) 5'-end guanylyltransferase